MSSVPDASKKSGLSADMRRLPFSPSPGPMKPRRQVPPGGKGLISRIGRLGQDDCARAAKDARPMQA
jgi:hypothetical protein